MYSTWQLGSKYLKHLITASSALGHGIHSPFVYRLIRQVFLDDKLYSAYVIVENLRKELKKDPRVIHVEDLGAGSSITRTNRRSISSIARYSAKSPRLSKLLYRITKDREPRTILEMGTSLGITTSYFALAAPVAAIYSLEGAEQVAGKAEENFRRLGLQNIHLIRGNFDDTLTKVIDSIPEVDIFFLDGNHRKEPTLRYFRQLLPKMHNEGIMIFDDIHWSREMEEAWEEIKKDPQVRCTLDIFQMGMAFFRQEFHEKQHFRLRF